MNTNKERAKAFVKKASFLILLGLAALFSASECLAELRAEFFDVGAADCILIWADGEAMLVDTGYAKTWPRVSDALRERGISELRYLAATHPHKDHIGAVPELLSEFPVASALLPPIEHSTKAFEAMMAAIEAAKLETIYPQPGDRFALGGAQITVYAPHPAAYDNLNDWSVVLMVRYAGRSLLLTGDIEAAAENDLLTNSDTLPLGADVLKVAHHGSDSSSTRAFIEAVRPRYAVVSCNSSEDLAYPSVETAMTLFECGVEDVFTTETRGDIAVVIDEDGTLAVSTQR